MFRAFWSNGRYQVWLDDTTDTLELLESNDTISVIIVSQRGRRPLGEIVYEFPKDVGDVPTDALRDVHRAVLRSSSAARDPRLSRFQGQDQTRKRSRGEVRSQTEYQASKLKWSVV
jgi:hypothetical protein